ncbi:SDR family oxidoreductase [Caulobacter sp. SLTY]|uniref:SDR family oxidoreductase n=1 Tax=Caulobacter sp. SLTY TaxID=2683262 RepID=UPI001411DEA3|nr:SDR family oxidoreductase [Caulobacter sp. SLTY]NBB14547.1 SDR family oxidoreductase [Caulobacter sp. SLTY]
MDLGIAGKTALVLGASSGLGRAMALALAREGANVALAARRADLLSDLAAECRALGVRALPIAWDLSDRSVIDANVSDIEQDLGPVDILINNTGGPPPTLAAGQDPDLWIAQFQSMVASVIAITDRVLPGMRQRKFGRILTSTSSGVVAPIPGLALSNALRLSLVGWSKTLAREVARDGVTCNVIVPGRISTDRTRFLDEKRAEREGKDLAAVEAASLAAIPMDRFGDPAEYGAVAAFLCSVPAAYVTGSIVRVDGGQIPSL